MTNDEQPTHVPRWLLPSAQSGALRLAVVVVFVAAVALSAVRIQRTLHVPPAVPEFNQGLVDRLRAEAADTLEAISGGDWSDETQGKVKEIVSEFADDFGYDLDEEGKPVDEDVDVDDRRKASSDDEEGGEAEASEEQEPGEADGERSETGAGAAA